MRKVLFCSSFLLIAGLGLKFSPYMSNIDWSSPQNAASDISKAVQQELGPDPEQRFSACHERLRSRGVKFKTVSTQSVSPNQAARGCHKDGAIKVRSIAGVSFGNEITLSCPAALAMTDWITKDILPLSQIKYGQAVKRINHIGTYQCRKIAGSSRMSQHSYANAIDIAGFVLQNGKRISVLNNWSKPARESDFLKSIGRAACGRFNVTLSPDYNAAHRDHFHMDMGYFRSCRVNDEETT